MPIVLEADAILNPITALAFLELGGLYVLAGEGQHLKVFEHQSGKLLRVEKIFATQSIHGIVCLEIASDSGHLKTRILIWGGRSISVVDVANPTFPKSGSQLDFQVLVSEIEATDWILDGCFGYSDSDEQGKTATSPALLVTAHNELLLLAFPSQSNSLTASDFELRTIVSGPRSILYSAHVICPRAGTILVAAGTALGEVIVWSLFHEARFIQPLSTQLRYTFTSHEGSVFGVRISEVTDFDNGTVSRVLASCSDDRTIRVWDISSVDNLNVSERKDALLATVMGHSSRIWGVVFIRFQRDKLHLLSFGEDSTTQIWRLHQPIKDQNHTYANGSLLTLSEEIACGYHTGKNLWAAAVLLETEGRCVVATGGADGRIATYSHHTQVLSHEPKARYCQYDMAQVTQALRQTVDLGKHLMTTSEVFKGMIGQWELSRKLQSSIPTYPSGTLTGTARLEERPVSDTVYDFECLYTERGDFVTEQGLTMKAKRQYVYRYQRERDTMSAWFVKADGVTVDYFFHKLDFQLPESELTKENAFEDCATVFAKGYHLCVDDEYTPVYNFFPSDNSLNEWGVKYIVKGPNKDYVADASYIRAPSNEDISTTSCGSNPRRSPFPLSGIIHPSPNLDSFKSYVWVSDKEFVVTTELGNLFLCTWKTKRPPYNLGLGANTGTISVTWETIGQHDDLGSSCVATSITSLGLAFFASKSGRIHMYSHNGRRLEVVHTVFQKVAYIKAELVPRSCISSPDPEDEHEIVAVFVTCLGSSQVQAFFLDPKRQFCNIRPQKPYVVDLHKGFIVTSSHFIGDYKLLALGSRNGGLAFYDFQAGSSATDGETRNFRFARLHGQDAIMAIETLDIRESNSEPNGFRILTAGRDGRYTIQKVLVIRDEGQISDLVLQALHESEPPFGPNIEGALLHPVTKELFLWGFRSKHFVVWNETQSTEVMTVECGGAHRNWAYSHLIDSNGGGNFVWTKASVCNLYAQEEASHRVLHPGGHGREIKAMAVSPCPKSEYKTHRQCIATGAEDTTIRIFEHLPGSNFRCLNILTKHTTGIQKLQWSADGEILFSAAACEEFYTWRVSSLPRLGIGVIWEARCPTVSESKVLRIMDFAVADVHHAESSTKLSQLITMVYSDSSVRVFHYHESLSQHWFSILLSGLYTTYCLTQVLYLCIGDKFYLCTGSTDGHLAFWPLSPTLTRLGLEMTDLHLSLKSNIKPDDVPITITCHKRIPVHQSSIKSLTSLKVSARDILIVTGGDDQALAFTRLTARDAESEDAPPVHATLIVPRAHASAITGITSLGKDEGVSHNNVHRFASVSDDQRLKTWLVTIDLEQEGVEGMRVRKDGNVSTAVADASALESYHTGSGERMLCVAGIGMESWILNSTPELQG